MTDDTEREPQPFVYTRLRENVPVTAKATVYEGHAPLRLLTRVGQAHGDHGETYRIEIGHTYDVLRVTGDLGGPDVPDVVVELPLRPILTWLANLAGWGLGLDMGNEAQDHLADALAHLETVKGMQVACDAARLLSPEVDDHPRRT